MAKLSTKPLGTCTRCRRFYSYRRVNGHMLCKSCGRLEKARHAFQPDPGRPIVCADCGMTRGSVHHSYLGSTRHIETVR